MNLITLSEIGQTSVVKPFDSLKLFKFTNFTVQSTGVTEERNLSLSYRYSFNSRRWSAIEPLTLSNIKNIKVDSLSFFYIEIFITRTGVDETGIITISDIIFEGDFQNISKDYSKVGRFGFRDDCDYSEVQCMNEFNNSPVVIGCEATFKPYDSTKTVPLWNKWANDATNIFGWDVDYYRVDPELNGRDDFLHEYGTLSYTEKQKVKIIVPDNKFPESGFQFNQFDLAMFDAFTISIMKDEFKKKFGLEHRPAEMDRIYICQIDKLYKVEHAQAFREFMNASIYYNLTLVKADDDKSIQNVDEMASLHDLIENKSLESLVGKNVEKDVKAIVNRTEQTNLLEERVRKEFFAPIRKNNIENGTNVISMNQYDLSSIAADKTAISYLAHDSSFNEGENRSFTCWFQITQHKPDMVYNLLNNLDNNGNGYRFDIFNSMLRITWGNQIFTHQLSLSTNTWFSIVINVDQRQQKVDSYLYKRHTPSIASTLKLVNTTSSIITPYEYKPIVADQLVINGSFLSITNLRLFSEVLNVQLHNSILNQYVIKDAGLLLMSDNALHRMIAPHFKF